MENETHIAVLENEIESMLLHSLLEERHIPHRIRSYHDTAYDGLFQTQRGWGAVYAPQSCREAVLEILETIRAQAEDSSGPK